MGNPGNLEVFAQSVSKYIKGFWLDIMKEGLERHLCEDKNKEKIKFVVEELFDKMMPLYVKENADLYPECYQVLNLKY